MSEAQTERFVFFVGAEDHILLQKTIHIFTPTLQETGALLNRLSEGDLGGEVILAWGEVLDDEFFDEFMALLEPARIAPDLYRVEQRPSIYIDQAIRFLNGTFTPHEDDVLNYAMMAIQPVAKMVGWGIKFLLFCRHSVALSAQDGNTDDLAFTARS
jgi:hypothetical protein